MLKRLLIAVFVFGLILTFSGTALSDVTKGELNPVVTINPNHARYGTYDDARPPQPDFKKPASALQKLPDGFSMPSPPLQYFCDNIDYSGAPFYYWTIPDAYGDDLFNMRFTSEPNFDCTLKVAWYLMYGSAMAGAPDMRAYLWDDDGFGFPGNKLDSVDILNANLPASGLGWVGADFSAANWVFSDGAEYHYGWTILQNSPTDVLAIISDDGNGPYAGEERASENWNGVWGTMLNDWGLDAAFNITSELCCGEIPFTDCYSQDYSSGIAYYWRAPHPVWGDEAYSMRFDVGGPETLVTVDLWIYDPGDGSFGNDDVIITIYGDAAGLPDPANVIDQVTLTAGSFPAFPTFTTVPFGIVIDQFFHVAFSSTGAPGVEYESCLSDDGSAGTGRSASDWGGGNWVSMLDGWGSDFNFVFIANMCRDEYALCSTQNYNDGLAYYWRLPDIYGDIAQGMRISSVGQECRVQEVSWALYDNGEPDIYTTNSKVSVYTNDAGLPGTELASIILTPADYVLYPGLMTVDFTLLDVYVSGDYFVTIESFAPTPETGIRTLSDDGSTPSGERAVELWGTFWATMLDDWGAEYDFVAYSEHCCIPFQEAFCDPGNDPGWSTYQGNQGRTGASELAASDAWCDLTLNWSYQDPAQGVAFTGPSIYGDKIICAFSTKYIVFNIADGSIAYTLDANTGDGQLIGNDIRNTATFANLNINGSPTDVMFISGGSVQAIGAIEFNTGNVIWQRTIFTVGGAGLFGQTRFSVFTLLNINGTDDVLYFSTDNGYLVAVDATTGDLYTGWSVNPVSMTGGCYISGATDGASIFMSTQTAISEGDIYSWDAATGNLNWTLSSTGGLQAQNIFASYNYPEGFRGGVAYSGGRLYAGSWANSAGASDHPTDGVYYTIDAGTGFLPIDAAANNRVLYSIPIVDANRVFTPTLSQWVGGTVGGGLIAFNKHTATIDWDARTPDDSRYYTNGFRTCEPDGADDLLFVFTEDGFLYCYNSVTGESIYRRRVDHAAGPNIGLSGAIAMANGELHIAFADFWGSLYDFTKGVDRARLEIATYNPTASVEFGADPALAINLGPIATNTGCIDLSFTNVLVDESPISGSSLPDFSIKYVQDQLMQRAGLIADELTANSFVVKNTPIDENIDNGNLINVRDINQQKESRRFATGVPPWLVSIDHPGTGDLLAPGATMDLELTVNQSLISRGPQSAYIAFETNDPDFFLNWNDADGAGLLPEILLTLVGGCLTDYTELAFGVGQANTQLVTNNGRLGTGDWSPHGFDIDGDNSSYYQGSYIYANATYRIAVNTQDWTSGGGEADAMVSMQADPNWCDNQCLPSLDADVLVGAISGDGGLTYDPIYADVVCKSYIDSVQNFDLGGGWDWSNFGAPFDDTLTMGLYVNTRTIGVKDFPALGNLTFEIMEFTERNGIDSVNGWYFGHIVDYDVGSDNANADAGVSAAWSYNTPDADASWGSIKIPFGCGDNSNGDWDFNPMINAVGLNGDIALWNHNAYYDSAYTYLSQYSGYTDLGMDNGDGEVHMTIASHDFEPNGTYSFGVAQFGVFNLTDASDPAEYADMANLVNKWAGFGRGDVNDDGTINLSDIIYLAASVNGGPGAVPFAHLGDVNADGNVDIGDVNYLINYYFNCGACPLGDWVI